MVARKRQYQRTARGGTEGGTVGNPRARNGTTRPQVEPKEASTIGHSQLNMAPKSMDVRPLFVSHFVEGPSQAEIPNVGLFSRRASSPSGFSPSVKGKKGIAQGRAPLSAKDSAACHSNLLNHILSTQALKPAINSQTHLSSTPSPKTSSHGASNCDEHEGRFTHSPQEMRWCSNLGGIIMGLWRPLLGKIKQIQ